VGTAIVIVCRFLVFGLDFVYEIFGKNPESRAMIMQSTVQSRLRIVRPKRQIGKIDSVIEAESLKIEGLQPLFDPGD
jgi:hypothetical protein